MTGIWRPLDLMIGARRRRRRHRAEDERSSNDYGEFGSPRMIYNLGHAVFEFIESRWGKEGLRQYLFALRKSVIGGGEDAYEEAFKIKRRGVRPAVRQVPEGSLQAVPRQGAAGRLRPQPRARSGEDPVQQRATRSSRRPRATCWPSSPATGAIREADIVLVSAKDGSVIRNLTSGFDQDKGFEFIVTPGGRWNTVPWMSWSPSGDRLAYFVRTEKSRTLILQNVLTRDIERAHRRCARWTTRSRPTSRPTAGRVVFAALQGGAGDIFVRRPADAGGHQPHQGRLRRLRADLVARTARSIVYIARVSGNEKLFRLDLDSGQQDAAHLRHPRRCDGAVPRRRHARLLRRRPPTRRSRSIPTWRATATSTTSGRSA